MALAERVRLAGTAGSWAPGAGLAGWVGPLRRALRGDESRHSLCLLSTHGSERTRLRRRAGLGPPCRPRGAAIANDAPPHLSPRRRGGHSRTQRKVGPRLSRRPAARAQRLRPVGATPSHRSFAQQVTPRTSDLGVIDAVSTVWLWKLSRRKGHSPCNTTPPSLWARKEPSGVGGPL